MAGHLADPCTTTSKELIRRGTGWKWSYRRVRLIPFTTTAGGKRPSSPPRMSSATDTAIRSVPFIVVAALWGWQ